MSRNHSLWTVHGLSASPVSKFTQNPHFPCLPDVCEHPGLHTAGLGSLLTHRQPSGQSLQPRIGHFPKMMNLWEIPSTLRQVGPLASPDPGSESVQGQKPLTTSSSLPVGTSAQSHAADTRPRSRMDTRPAQAHLNMETIQLDAGAGSDFPEPTRKTSATKPSDQGQWPPPQPRHPAPGLGHTHDIHEGEDVVLHVLLAVEAHHRVVHHQ